MKVTYINCHDENGHYLDKTKRLDEDINVGYIIQWSMKEGYENWEVTHILKEEKENVQLQAGNSVERIIVHVKVKKHPYVKTHCDHEWKNSKSSIQTLEAGSLQSFLRKCNKCSIQEKYNWGTCKWDLIEKYSVYLRGIQ
jgi:hypothetical protein